MASSGSTGQVPIIVSGGITGCASLPVSVSSASLYCGHIFISLSLPFLNHSLAPLSGTWVLLSVWSHLRNSLRRARPCSCIMAPGRGHLKHGLYPRPAWHKAAVHLRLAPSGSHGTSGSDVHLRLIPLLAYPAGRLSWTHSHLGYGPRQSSSGLQLACPGSPSRSGWHRSSGCLRLAPCPGPLAAHWEWAQVPFSGMSGY